MSPLSFSLIKQSVIATPVIAILVGLVTAIGCIIFHLLIDFFVRVFWGINDTDIFISTITTLSITERILVPALGGFLVGVIYTYIKVPEVQGEGVPQVLQAVNLKKSVIRIIVAPVKILASAITLASGGSAGREGPIVQIGSAIGSTIGKLTGQNENSMRLLLAAGAAAGIGGTFGAPLAGVLFSTEIILKKISMRSVIVLSTAAFTSYYLTTYVLGFPGFRLVLPESFSISLELLLVSLLVGLLAGVVSVGFGYSINKAEDIFKKIKMPTIATTTLGGLLIGMIGIFIPFIHEPATYPLMINLLSVTSFSIQFLIILLIIKVVATAITLGSGGAGGILAPALLTGLLFGVIINTLLPTAGFLGDTNVVAFGLIGMAAVFAGVTHAPFMSIILLYEITNEPLVLILLLASTFIAYKTSIYLREESVYESHVTKRSLL